MKVIKGLILFCFLGVSVSACFDPPEFSIVPQISYNKVQFKETPSLAVHDTLILYIDFKDGDGDLGLNDNFLEEPFNDSFYYIADGTGDTARVTTEIVYTTEGIPYFLLQSEDMEGLLVTDRTRLEPNYGYLPVYDPNSCENYSDAQLLVPAVSVNDTYNIVDTLYNQLEESFYVIEGEHLLYKRNIYHNNIEVRYWVFQNGDFVEFDWFEEFCFDFNGRFPVLTDQVGSPLEGSIRYAMPSSSFLALFSVKALKLSVKIRDRSLNTSKEIFTPQFELDDVRVN